MIAARLLRTAQLGELPMACTDHLRLDAGEATETEATATSTPFTGMGWIPGGTCRMGSNKHYPEERPVHRVSVDGFWMDRHPVTNARFERFIDAASHVTFAEIPPAPRAYPRALPHMLYAGSLVFVKPDGPVDRRNIGHWWQFMRGADWRHPQGPDSSNDEKDRKRTRLNSSPQ